MSTSETDKLLEERGSIYGSFAINALTSQRLCQVIRNAADSRPLDSRLTPYQTEALEMIAHKMARILSGDPEYADNWDDIAGYAMLGKDPR